MSSDGSTTRLVRLVPLMAVVNPLLRPVGLILLIIAALILLALTRREVFWPLVAAASSAGVLAYVIDNAMKVIVDRGRPPAYLSDVLFHGYPTDPRGSGYPSSHAAVAVAVIVGAWPWLDRRWRVIGTTVAAMIALNRAWPAHLPRHRRWRRRWPRWAGSLVVAQRLSGSRGPDDRVSP